MGNTYRRTVIESAILSDQLTIDWTAHAGRHLIPSLMIQFMYGSLLKSDHWGML